MFASLSTCGVVRMKRLKMRTQNTYKIFACCNLLLNGLLALLNRISLGTKNFSRIPVHDADNMHELFQGP